MLSGVFSWEQSNIVLVTLFVGLGGGIKNFSLTNRDPFTYMVNQKTFQEILARSSFVEGVTGIGRNTRLCQ